MSGIFRPRSFAFLGWVAVSLTPPLAAQAPARLGGRVYDAATGAPLPLAELALGELRTVSGADGGYRFGSVSPGTLVLEVRRVGYAPWRGRIDIAPGLDHAIAVPLAPLPLQLDSLTVVASPGAIRIAGEELMRRGHDLARALDGWEGITVRRAGSGGPAAPQLRGGAPDEVLVLVDGFALNDPLTGRADLSAVATGEVSEVRLLPGVQTTRAGARAVAGVLVVETRRAARPEAGGWLGSHGGRGARIGGSIGPLALGLRGERHARGFSYDVPEVRGGGTAERGNAGGSLYGISARLDQPFSLVLRATASDRGLPGTTTNPTLGAQARDRSALLGVRAGAGRRARWHGALQWLETSAADTAPPTGAPYDTYTHGVGVAGGGEYALPVSGAGWSGEAAVAADVRGDRFGGDGVRDGASFTHASLRTSATMQRGRRAVWTVSPALRLDGWTGATSPRSSLRVDAAVHHGSLSATLGIGSGVTPPVLADLLFREGVGVRLNPDLRPERVPWEIDAGIRTELPGGRGAVAVRGFYGRVEDMVVWAPDFRFIWSPRNFDVRRRGGEVTVALRPTGTLQLDASAAYAAVTYDRDGGAQVQYRPRTTLAASAAWAPERWVLDLRWRRIGGRYPNSAGTNALPPISLLDLSVERELGPDLTARGEVRDLADARAEFIAGHPTPGRTLTLTLEFSLP